MFNKIILKKIDRITPIYLYVHINYLFLRMAVGELGVHNDPP